MRAGELRNRVTIQRRDAIQDDYGQQVTTWTDVIIDTPDHKIAAKIEGLSVRGLFAAQAMQSEVSHKITLRYHRKLADPQAVASMRIVYGSRIFSIADVINIDERNRELNILASEGLNDG